MDSVNQDNLFSLFVHPQDNLTDRLCRLLDEAADCDLYAMIERLKRQQAAAA